MFKWLQIYIGCVDQNLLYIFVVKHFLIAFHAFEIRVLEARYLESNSRETREGDAEKQERLLSLRLSASCGAVLEAAISRKHDEISKKFQLQKCSSSFDLQEKYNFDFVE